ncbi:MAG: ABC transporter permease [Chloroflexota bacterium]
MRALWLQTAVETKLWLRRRDRFIFSLALPVMFLVFFGALYGNQKSGGHVYIDYIVPGYAVFAILAVALSNVAANLAGERQYGILKRLQGTPLRRWMIVMGKVLAASVLLVGVILVLVVVGILVYHAQLLGNQLAAILVLAVGILSFAAMGISMGGIMKADSAVAVGSLVYLALSFLGGVFIPLSQFPPGLHRIAEFLPSARLVDALRQIWTYGHGLGSTGMDLPIVLAWGVGALLVAGRRFRWE